MKNKQHVKTSTSIGMIVLLYLLTSFIHMDLDPNSWGPFSRIAVVFLWVCSIVIVNLDKDSI